MHLSPLDMNILKWVREGKTNDEIGTIIGKSKWAVKYHLKKIMKEFGVTSRTQAVSQAIGLGLLSSVHSENEKKGDSKLKVVLVGCGKGGSAILEILSENPLIEIVGVAESDLNAVGIKKARDLHIKVKRDYKQLISGRKDLDVIIDVTGSNDVREELMRIKSDKTELMGGISAMLMWQLADERRKRFEDKERMLKEHENLYHLGLIIENIDSMRDVTSAILDYATRLTHMPAGSISIFDEKNDEMVLVASKGFSNNFKKIDRWRIRKGGLTSTLFNQNMPVFIDDVRDFDNANSLLIEEGIRSILATPLIAEGKIVGLLYVNDFKKRGIRAEDTSLFALLAVYAAMTIERVRSIEEMRRLSIVDGLTDLYNHRYIMQQIEREHLRASRHKSRYSIIMLDIDHFKAYNDNFGHLEGNKVLKEMSKLFKKIARSTDVVARFGGEEFCILAPELCKKDALAFAKRLAKKISEFAFPNRKLTLSGGVATFPDDGNSPHSLIEKADESLYDAKNKGRNRVCG